MADKLHKLWTIADGIHIVYAWEVAALGDITTTDADIGKIAKIADRYYLLCDRQTGEGGTTSVWREVAADLTTLSASISTNTANIATHTTAIATNATAIATKADALYTINAQTGTTYTLVLADAGKLITLSNAGATTLTVPTNAVVPFPVGTVVALAQLGAGQVTVAGAGVTLRTPYTLRMTKQYSRATLEKIATDTWLLSGDLAVA